MADEHRPASAVSRALQIVGYGPQSDRREIVATEAEVTEAGASGFPPEPWTPVPGD